MSYSVYGNSEGYSERRRLRVFAQVRTYFSQPENNLQQ